LVSHGCSLYVQVFPPSPFEGGSSEQHLIGQTSSYFRAVEQNGTTSCTLTGERLESVGKLSLFNPTVLSKNVGVRCGNIIL